VWRWDQAEPFGNNPADEDPDANSVAFDLPLRLPGQRHDAETGLHYNGLRDYSADNGGFSQADPIGIVPYRQAEQRLNHSFAYADSDPLRSIDPLGLCPCRGCHWTQGQNFAAGLMVGGGIQVSINAIFTCKSDPAVECKANVFCIGGGAIISGGIGADLTGDVYHACSSGELGNWSSGLMGSAGPFSSIGFFGGGGSASIGKSFGGGVAYVSCRAYQIRCNCPCSK